MKNRSLQIGVCLVRDVCVLLCISVALLACGGTKKDANSADDTFIPQETQKRSEKNYGQQQGMMEDLSASPAEQAAARHDAKVRDARDPQDEEN
jgi:hypothetical protein